MSLPGFSFRTFGLLAASLALLGGAALVSGAGTVSADQTCEQDGMAIGSGDSDSETCPAGDVTFNEATAENDSDSWLSFAAAWARTETNGPAATGGNTYANSYNSNTPLGAALTANNVLFDGVAGTKLNAGSSAYALAQNQDSMLVAAGAYNNLLVTNVGTGSGVVDGSVYSTATNSNCYLCLAGSLNDVRVSDSSMAGGVIFGPAYANSTNDYATLSKATAANSITIDNASVTAWVLDGFPVGSNATANNVGLSNDECVACHATAYNTLRISDVEVTDGSFIRNAQALATNDLSSGSTAFAANNADFKNLLSGQLAVSSAYAFATNNSSPNSTAEALNDVAVGNGGNQTTAGSSILSSAVFANSSNEECETCSAISKNWVRIGTEDGSAIAASQDIIGDGTFAEAVNEGALAPGFAENSATAFNYVEIEGAVAAENGNIVTGGANAFARNYVGPQEQYGSCYECVAFADNSLKIVDTSAGLSVVDTDVYATAENYNSDEVLAKAKNKVIITGSNAYYHVIADAENDPGSVYAFSTNRYCYECTASADNFVKISDISSSEGNILNGHAYAWAENNIGAPHNLGFTEVYAEEEEEDEGRTAIAFNTLIIDDNSTTGDSVAANVFSCATNNVGGANCGLSNQRVTSTDVYQGECISCLAVANNSVKLSGASVIDSDANNENNLINSLGGVYAYAENTAQGDESMEGACDTCLAGAKNNLTASNTSLVDGTVSATAINANVGNGAAGALNNVNLDNGQGHGEASAYNQESSNVLAAAANNVVAESGGTAVSTTGAVNENTTGGAAIGIGEARASNGGTATNSVMATTGSTGSEPAGGVAVAIGQANADNTNVAVTSTADLTNDGTSSGTAYSVSYDENGNVAVAVIVTGNGYGTAVTYASGVDGTASANADADGSNGETSGDISFSTGDPEAQTSTSP